MEIEKNMTNEEKIKNAEAESSKESSPIETKESGVDFFIVAIGASAGGLEALQEFYKNTPEYTGVAFIVIQHLSPDYKSLMDELLSRYTRLPIHKVTDGTKVEVDNIYLIPPKKNMTIFHRKLFLTDQNHGRGMNMPIDIFMQSLAKDHGKNAIGVILSGTGSDGTLGIKAIKENGGMVIAQDHRSAKFDGMPRSSISTGMVDYILTPGEMPEALINYVKHPFIQKREKIESQITQEQDYLSKIIMIIRDVTGIDFSHYKESTIIRRLEKRISINRYNTISDYVSFLSDNKREINILYKELLIGVTRFFRDIEAFNKLRKIVIPNLFNNASNQSTLRIWCIGCSTGEEAYSLAILLSEYMEENNINKNVKLFATDIDRDSVEFAGLGMYPESIVSDISPERLSRYFTRKNEEYQINEQIRSMVIFATHNVLKDPPFSKIDLISCRNMLIYLNSEVQQKVLSMFYFSLNKTGYLFLGSSESVGDLSSGFQLVDSKSKIYKYQPGYNPPISEAYKIPGIPKKSRELKTVGTYMYQTKKNVSKLDNIFDELLSDYVPPSVILDENYNIVHTIHNINNFITLPVGQVSLNILDMLPESHSAMVSSLLRKAKKQEATVVYENLKFEKLDNKPVRISGRKLIDQKTNEIFYMVSFQIQDEQIAKNKDSVAETVDVNNKYQERIRELERELQYNKESLQATVEELETSNEELQSSNEELIASNEELQSTNEELQSVNEELHTVNAEHQHKIEELTQLNNDINNLLKTTSIGTLFLDNQLRIRKLTDIAADITNIRQADIGRPINHFSLDHIHNQFLNDIQYVLETLNKKEIEIQYKNSEYYLVRILPYRTAENAVDGIIITFVDITLLKESEEKYKKLFNSNHDAILVADKDRNIIDANPATEKLFGYSMNQLLGKKTSYIYADETTYKNMGKQLQQYKKDKGFIKLIPYKNNKDEVFYGETKVFQIEDTKGKTEAYVGLISDITDKLQAEKKMKMWEYTVNAINDGIILIDEKYNIIQSNKAFRNIMGIEEKDAQTLKSYQIIHGTKTPPKRCVTCKALYEKKSISHEYWEPHLNKYLRVSIYLVYDDKGNFDFAVETIEDMTKEKQK
ncbi:MAG: CheR family methyltransferase [Bacteroidales bacterium]